jgi:hypothetical protein
MVVLHEPSSFSLVARVRSKETALLKRPGLIVAPGQ